MGGLTAGVSHADSGAATGTDTTDVGANMQWMLVDFYYYWWCFNNYCVATD